jgi:hypothetical protein
MTLQDWQSARVDCSNTLTMVRAGQVYGPEGIEDILNEQVRWIEEVIAAIEKHPSVADYL